MFAGFTDTVRNRIDSTLMSQKGNKSTQLFQMTDTALNQYAFTRLGREEKSSLRFTNAFNTIVYFMLIRRTVLSGVQNVLAITTRMNTRQEMFLVFQQRFHIQKYS